MDLPRNLVAERSLIGILLNNNQVVYDCQNLLWSDFYEQANGELFRLVCDQVHAGRGVTATTLLHDAQDAPIWGDLKASEYIYRLEQDAPSASVAPELVRTIRDVALRRRLIETMLAEAERVAAAPVSITGQLLREQVETSMAALFTSVSDLGLRSVQEAGDRVLDRLKENTSPPVLKLPLVGLSNLLGDLLPGKVYMIGGSPGAGKSALLAQIADHAAKAGKTTGIWSPEMSDEDIAIRQMGSVAGVNSADVAAGNVSNADYEKLFMANVEPHNRRIIIDPHSRPTLAMIRARATRAKRLGELDLIGIDHVHYMGKSDRRMMENDALDENLSGLKALAGDLGVPIIALCQFGTDALRRMATWPHPSPTQGDLLYSGTIDRHADGILLIHRREFFLNRSKPTKEAKHYAEWSVACTEWEGKAEVILTKRRHGGRSYGEETIYFEADKVRFSDQAPSRYAQKGANYSLL